MIKNIITKNNIKTIVFIFILIVVIILVAYQVFGYGKLKVNNAESLTTVYVDLANKGDGSKPIKLRPGKYLVYISSPIYEYTNEVNVNMFGTNVINMSDHKRDFSQTVADLTQTDIENQSLRLIETKTFQGDLWYGGILVIDDQPAELFVMQFKDGRWQMYYRGYSIADKELKNVPSDVFDHIQELAQNYMYSG